MHFTLHEGTDLLLLPRLYLKSIDQLTEWDEPGRRILQPLQARQGKATHLLGLHGRVCAFELVLSPSCMLTQICNPSCRPLTCSRLVSSPFSTQSWRPSLCHTVISKPQLGPPQLVAI